MSHRLKILILFCVAQVGCGLSQEERQNTAAVTCSIIGETRNMDAAVRVREMNVAREKLGEPPYLGGDKGIKESISWGICEQLVLNDPAYDSVLKGRQKVADEERRQRLEADRIARIEREARQAEEDLRREEAERIAREEKEAQEAERRRQKEEAKRIAREQKEAQEAEERRQKEAAERIAAAQLASVIAEYRKAAEEELSKYKFSVKEGYNDGLRIIPEDGSIYLDVHYITTEGALASFDDSITLVLDSIVIDFEDPELPDFINQEIRLGSSPEFSLSSRFREEVYFKRENRLTRDQRELFISKFGTSESGRARVRPPKSAFKVLIRVKGVYTYSFEPYEFECRHFEILRSKDLCSMSGYNEKAVFSEPIEIIIQSRN